MQWRGKEVRGSVEMEQSVKIGWSSEGGETEGKRDRMEVGRQDAAMNERSRVSFCLTNVAVMIYWHAEIEMNAAAQYGCGFVLTNAALEFVGQSIRGSGWRASTGGKCVATLAEETKEQARSDMCK